MAELPEDSWQRAIHSKHVSFFEWDQALWRYLLESGADRVVLNVDESSLNSINPPSGTSVGFLQAVTCWNAGAWSPKHENDLAYSCDLARRTMWDERLLVGVNEAYPGYLPILAVSVLAASNMQGTADYTAGAYYRHLNTLLGFSANSNLLKDGFSKLESYWMMLDARLRRTGRELALPPDPRNQPYKRRPNINFPISQCLFRRADIIKLHDDLVNIGSERGTGEEYLSHLIARNRKDVSAPLQGAFDRIKRGDDALRLAYASAIGSAISTARTIVRPEAIERGPRTGTNIWPLRLITRRLPTKILDIILQIDRGDGEDREWTELFDIDGNQIAFSRYQFDEGIPQTSYVDPASSIEHLLYLPNDYEIWAFIRDDFHGTYAYYPRYPKREFAGAPLRLLGTDRAIGLVTLWHAGLRAANASLPKPIVNELVERLKGLSCVDIVIPHDAKWADLPEPLRRFVSSSQPPRPQLRGYRIDGKFLLKSPLRVEIRWPDEIGHSPAYEYKGNKLQLTMDGGVAVADLTQFTSSAGLYELSPLNSTDPVVRFEVAEARIPDFTPIKHASHFSRSFLKLCSGAEVCNGAVRMAAGGSGYLISGAALVGKPV